MRHSSMVLCRWLLILAVLYTGSYSQGDKTDSMTSSIKPTPSLTSTNAPATTSSHMTTSSPAPTPTPPQANVILYRNTSLYLRIQNISIDFLGTKKFANLTGASLQKMPHLNDTFNKTDSSHMTFKRFYGTKGNPLFFLAFFFYQDTSTDDKNWFLNNFQHGYLDSKHNNTLFQYKGIEYSIWAPAGLQYQCTDITLHGSGGEAPVITTSVHLVNISIEPFLKNGSLSKYFFDCARTSTNNETIGLVVGLVLALAVVLAAVIAIISILVSRRVSTRGYDILRD